jgi:hypothetical protein
LGAGGVTLKTATPFTNGANANFSVDAGAGDGGSRITFGGTLTNKGTLDLGNTGLSALTKVTAQGLVNDKTIALSGSSKLAVATSAAGESRRFSEAVAAAYVACFRAFRPNQREPGS